jgi:hypothetical protein
MAAAVAAKAAVISSRFLLRTRCLSSKMEVVLAERRCCCVRGGILDFTFLEMKLSGPSKIRMVLFRVCKVRGKVLYDVSPDSDKVCAHF